jgi:NaMN:DMB phosphoribosyltransferase
MGAIFSPPKPKGPDPGLIAAQKQQLEDERKRAAELEAQKQSRLRAMLGRGSGRVSLLGGAETGVPDSATAGAEKLG